MKRLTAVFSILALMVSAASADAIADRKALMKERGGIVGGLSKVAKGETPFDAAAVLALSTAWFCSAVDTFLAGADSDYITGQSILTDGGIVYR